jgi:hypothetical protein
VSRIVIVGGPRCGKSWLAANLSLETTEGSGPLGTSSIYCGDPLSTVKDPMPTVHYLPEGIPYSGNEGAAAWIAEHWFSMAGPWICEGHVMARALQRYIDQQLSVWDFWDQCAMPCDKIIVFEEQRSDQILKPGQLSQHKGVMTTWRRIRDYFDPIVEYR